MTKLEADYKKDIVDAFKSRGWYARRVEDQYAVGTLDMILCSPKTGLVLCEVKRVKSGSFAPSPRQFIEIDRIRNAGGKWIMVGVNQYDEFMGYCGPLSRHDTIKVGQCVALGHITEFPDLFERMME